jgi:uncharacterized membrane protein YdjX (TVP38/TMEM64 family)
VIPTGRTPDLRCEADANGAGAAQLPTSSSRRNRRGLRRYIGPKRTLGLVSMTIIIAGTWYLRGHHTLDPVLLQRLVHDYTISAPLLMILIYALGVLSGLPTLPINLAAGVFWGSVLGGLISTTGATLGAVVAFAAARSIFGRPLARRFDNKLVAEFQREFEEKGWRFIAFARLNPVFPTGPLNYILGLTAIDSFTYVWATFAFLLPPSIAAAFIGQSIGTFVIEGEIADTAKLVLAVSAGVTALAVLAYGARLIERYRRKVQ